MKHFIILTLALLSFVQGANAGICPWKQSEELFKIDSDSHRFDLPLSANQMKEDLFCLKLLFQNFYTAQDNYPQIDLIARIDKSILEAKASTNTKLLNRIFNLHQGMYDLHLRYTLKDVGRGFESHSSQEVQISEELAPDKIHEKNGYVYFKSGDLLGDLTSGQAEFVDFIEHHDVPFVLDLRGNGGGDDKFAEKLAETLYTPSQKIPKATSYQVESALVNLGLLNLVRILHYRGMEEYEAEVLDQVKNKSFDQLLPFEIAQEEENYQGKRVAEFRSKFIVIIDSGCASSCETIVEKISAHPNAKIIGVNTYGALHFSNAMTFQLPHSGIIVSIPTLRHVYENDAPEGQGYAPSERTDFVDLKKIKF